MSIFKILKKVLRIFFLKMTSDHYALIFKQGNSKTRFFCFFALGFFVIFCQHILREMLSKNPKKSRENYYGENCDYSTSQLNELNKHKLTTQPMNVDKMLSKNPKKSQDNYYCEHCDYSTSHLGDFKKHESRRKHLYNVENDIRHSSETPETLWKCACERTYRFRQSYYRHKKTCNGTIPFHKSQGVSSDMKSLLHELQQQREEDKGKNMEMVNMMLAQFKEIIPLVGSTTNNTNCNNNTFNMNVFLNETCKDAMNLDDFVKTLQFNTDDLLYTAENGYVEGVGKILLRGLDALSIEQRPIHCSDMKREVMYVKKDGVWAKDTADNEELRKTILLVGRMNVRSLPPWMKANPMYAQADSPFSDIYAQIIVNTLVESEEKGRNYTTKVIKNIAKRCHIDRKMNEINYR